jgi:hypothetical protein
MQSGTLLARLPPKPFRNGVTTSIVWSSHGYAEVGVITHWLFRISFRGVAPLSILTGPACASFLQLQIPVGTNGSVNLWPSRRSSLDSVGSGHRSNPDRRRVHRRSEPGRLSPALTSDMRYPSLSDDQFQTFCGAYEENIYG